MVRKLEVKPEVSKLTVGGFVEGYPQELIGIVPVKEYIQAIEIINTNIVRDYQSWIWVAITYFWVGLIPILILGFVELARYLSFKKKVMRDIKPVIESINRSMSIRNVTFNAKLASSFTCRLIIEVSFPEGSSRSPPTIIQQVDGRRNALLLEPFANPQPLIANPRTHFESYHPTDTNFKNILIPHNDLGWAFRGNKGWEVNGYSNKLYNYLSIQEYTEMINDYNKTCMVEFNNGCTNFFIFSVISCFFLIGIILIMPAFFWFVTELNKYNTKLNKSLVDLNAKYNSMYGPRGISITNILPFAQQTNRIFLNIYLPRDVGNAPTLTTILPSDQLLIAPTMPGGYAPNYQFISPVAQVALHPIPVQTTSIKALNN